MQFSLRTALKFVALFAFILALYAFVREQRENQRLREENTELRSQTGEVEIASGQEKFLHAVGMQTLDPQTWRWMLHVPAAGKYVVHATVGQVPRTGNATGETMSLPLETGGNLLVIGIRRDLDGKLQWMLEAKGAHAQLPVPPASADWIERGSESECYTGTNWGGHRILEDPRDEFELLRLRTYATPPPPNVFLASPGDGVVLWIEQE